MMELENSTRTSGLSRSRETDLRRVRGSGRKLESRTERSPRDWDGLGADGGRREEELFWSEGCKARTREEEIFGF